MSGKSALSLLVTFSLFFAGCAASNTMGKQAAQTADINKAEAASAAPEDKGPKAEAKKQYIAGLISMNHANWEKAAEHFLEAIKLNPDHYNTRMYLARVYEKMKKNPEAADQYKEAIKLKPDNPNPYAGLIGVYLDMGLPDDAIATVADATGKGLKESEFVGDLGWAYYVKGDFGNAEKYFKEAKELNKDDSTPRNNLGLLYFRQGRYDDALASFKEGAELNKKSVVLPYFMALTYNRLGRDDEVLNALREGLKRDPDLEKKANSYNASFLPGADPGDLSAVFKKLKEEKN